MVDDYSFSLVDPISGAQFTNQLSIAYNFQGYIREMKMWQQDVTQDFLSFYNRQVENAHKIKYLLHYWPLLG